jgi:hypothetical protein
MNKSNILNNLYTFLKYIINWWPNIVDLTFDDNRSCVVFSTIVNVTNILRAAFVPISFCHKLTNLNSKHIKAEQNTYVQKAASKLLVKATPGCTFAKKEDNFE